MSDQQAVFECIGQGILDLSVEALIPAHKIGQKEQTFDFQLGVSVNPHKDSDEVDVSVALRGDFKKDKQEKSLIIELSYGGSFVATGLPEDQKDAILHIDAPALLYPFARHVFMQAAQFAGYQVPPLQAVNFMALYRQQLDARKESSERKEEGQLNG